jgi:hypothetical protein
MNIVALSGYAGVGKDACAEMLVRRYGFYHCKFADVIKQMVGQMLGVPARRFEDREWKETIVPWLGRTPRELLQTLGTDWGRELVHPDVWVKTTMYRVRFMSRVVVSDCRFDNEAQAVRDAGGKVINITRPGFDPVNDHRSEIALSPASIDRGLINDGSLEHLFRDLVWKMDSLGYQLELQESN